MGNIVKLCKSSYSIRQEIYLILDSVDPRSLLWDVVLLIWRHVFVVIWVFIRHIRRVSGLILLTSGVLDYNFAWVSTSSTLHSMDTHAAVYRIIVMVVETIIQGWCSMATRFSNSRHTAGSSSYFLLRVEWLIRTVVLHFKFVTALVRQWQDSATSAFIITRPVHLMW
jgi:hypothetical protein